MEKLKLGDGKKVKFLEDIWVGIHHLKCLFLRLFVVTSDKDLLVEERLIIGAMMCCHCLGVSSCFVRVGGRVSY